MNRIYVADKPTLDKVDANTVDTKGKVGTTVDVGGAHWKLSNFTDKGGKRLWQQAKN